MLEPNFNHIQLDEKKIVASMGFQDFNVPEEISRLVHRYAKDVNNKIKPSVYIKKIKLDNTKIFDKMHLSLTLKDEFKTFNEIYNILVTLGSNFDSFIAENKQNNLHSYIIDAIGNYAISQLMERVYEHIRSVEDNNGKNISKLYCPGTDYWSLKGQKWLFDSVIKTSLDKKEVVIKLTEDMLLIPSKSLSGCIGVYEKVNSTKYLDDKCYDSCDKCHTKGCYRSKEKNIDIIIIDGDITKKFSVCHGTNLLILLQSQGINILAPCNGVGRCGKCKVIITKGTPPATKEEKRLLTEEEINKGIRLACFVRINHAMECSILQNKISSEIKGQEAKHISINPHIKLNQVENNGDYRYEILYKERLISLVDKKAPVYGVAIDIGTTTVVVTIVDLKTGQILGTLAEENSQRSFGSDVISRITFSNENNEGLELLKERIVNQVNSILKDLYTKNELNKDSIYHTVVVGNPTMIHLFLGINPNKLGVAPYIPAFSNTFDLIASKVGLNVNGFVTFPALISGFVGSDIAASMLASPDFHEDKVCMLIDLGTNGEMVLSTGESYYCCSTAAGPAFEAVNIYNGTASIPGAITAINPINGKVNTIYNKPPVGICGTGVIQIIAQLIKQGYIDNTGLLCQKNSGLFKVEKDNDQLYQVVLTNSSDGNKIVLKQKDIRQVQMAKAAIATGIEILCSTSGISYKNIDKVYVAGGFGHNLDIESAIIIGLFPHEFKGKIVSIGHGALEGAKRYLLSIEEASKLEQYVKKSKSIDLALSEDFYKKFIEHMNF